MDPNVTTFSLSCLVFRFLSLEAVTCHEQKTWRVLCRYAIFGGQFRSVCRIKTLARRACNSRVPGVFRGLT